MLDQSQTHSLSVKLPIIIYSAFGKRLFPGPPVGPCGAPTQPAVGSREPKLC
jgi:hypothetical protein